MGQREGLSKGDITKINEMYKCPEKTASVTGSMAKPGNGGDNENKENSNSLANAASNILGWIF